MSVRRLSLAARLAGVPMAVDQVNYDHSVSLRAGDVVGSDASVRWAEGRGVIRASQVAHPFQPGWSRTNGKALEVDVTGPSGTHRVFAGQIEASGGSLVAGSSSQLVDAVKRLQTKVSLPPLAFTMPPRPDVVGAILRRPGLWGTWYTHLAMTQAGFHPCQKVYSSTVWYQSFAGSGWTAPNPDHATDTLGHLTQIHRLSDPSTSPGVYQGTNTPCMVDVSALGSTLPRRNSSSTAWQLTVDMATDTPDASHTGQVDLRPLPVSAGPGLRMRWTEITLYLERINPDNSTELLDLIVRSGLDGKKTMRWSAVVRPNGTLTLHGSGGRLNASVHTVDTGIRLPSGADRATVAINSPGPISAVQVNRSESTVLVTQPVTARIHRSTFSQRSLAGFDYVAPTPAIDILAGQADAERGLGAMPIWMWMDEDGVLRNADAAWLWGHPREHVFTNVAGEGIPLDDVAWSVPADGPHSRVNVRCRFANVKVRTSPTLLLAVGGQKNHENGDVLDEFLHPDDEDTWLQPDLAAYAAGVPLPPPGSTEFNKGWGTWVGGTRVDSDGDPSGWITPAMITGWTVDASNHVQGALAHIDHRTILYKGTVAVGGSFAMSSMPSSASAGLAEHRKSQPLPQIRGGGRIDWTEAMTSVSGPGTELDPVLDHDGGMWVQNSVWRQQTAEALAAASASPVPVFTLTVALDPSVRVGHRAIATVVWPDGAKLAVEGLVAGVSATIPNADDTMQVRLVGLSTTWQGGDGALGGDPAAIGGEHLRDDTTPPPALPPIAPYDTTPPIFIPTP